MAKKRVSKKAAKRGGKKTATKAKRGSAAKKARARKVAAIPADYGAVTVHLVVHDGAAAMEFYKNAFGAKERQRMVAPDGALLHGEIKVGGSMVMLGAEMPGVTKSPKTLGGSGAVIHLYVKNADKVFARAVEAGATVLRPLADQFWGDRYGQVVDPFGHTWSIATHIEDVRPKEMARRATASFAQGSPAAG